MQLTVSMLVGLLVGVGLFAATKRSPSAAVWTALVLGVVGTALFIATINGWLLPDLGRFGMIGIGMISGIASALAIASVWRGQRKPLNWIAMLVAVPPVLFLIVFGAAELMGSPR